MTVHAGCCICMHRGTNGLDERLATAETNRLWCSVVIVIAGLRIENKWEVCLQRAREKETGRPRRPHRLRHRRHHRFKKNTVYHQFFHRYYNTEL